MRPDPGIVREFVWEPIADLGEPVVFAFGAPWFGMLERLGVDVHNGARRETTGGREIASHSRGFGNQNAPIWRTL